MEGMTSMHKYTMNQYNFYPLHEETVCINKYLNISPLNHQSRQNENAAFIVSDILLNNRNEMAMPFVSTDFMHVPIQCKSINLWLWN